MTYRIGEKPERAYDQATKPQVVSAVEQAANLAVVRQYFHLFDCSEEANLANEKYIAPHARIWSDSRPSDNPVIWDAKEVYFGPAGMKTVGDAYAHHGFTYSMVIHAVHVSGPVVVLARTDIRRQDGRPDKPIPAVGILAVRDGKIIQWSDWYR
jgi:limonene-1,2-epoxide hydrolase